ncbi:MAG: putative Zn-dependent protease, partial [Myxococcota bacterium]
RYAEAVTKLNTPQAADALAGLEKLAAKDMMPDAMGWVTLATLRARAGNVAESKTALQACKKQARDATMCVLTLAPGQG